MNIWTLFDLIGAEPLLVSFETPVLTQLFLSQNGCCEKGLWDFTGIQLSDILS